MHSVYWSDSYTFRQKEILCGIGKCRELSPGNRLSVCLCEMKTVWTTDSAVGTSCPIFCSKIKILFSHPPFCVHAWGVCMSNLVIASAKILRRFRIYFECMLKKCINPAFFAWADSGTFAISKVTGVDLSRLIRHLILWGSFSNLASNCNYCILWSGNAWQRNP